MNKKIALIGSGIKTISHLTTEAKTYIEHADCVLYLINEPIFESWLIKHSKKCMSLEKYYFLHEKRSDSYKKIIAKIISLSKKYDFISVVLYGHPVVFSSLGIDTIKKAQKQNIETVILPGISTEDCLFADLEIDPSQNGCFSVEATNFIIFDDVINVFSDLIIWQVGIIGNIGSVFNKNSKDGLALIQKKLLQTYSPEHEIILYEASLYPGVQSKIVKFPLQYLMEQDMSSLSTLYVPAKKRKTINRNLFSKLNLKIDDFQ